MVEIGKVDGIRVDLEDFLLFNVSLDDMIYGLIKDMPKQLMLFAKSASDIGLKVKLETHNGSITIECTSLKTLYFEDEESRPGCRYLAITRLENDDGVDYFIAFSDTASHDYIHYIEYVDRNVESQRHLYDDITEFIYVDEWDAEPRRIDQWINLFRDQRILGNFPEFDHIIKELEWLKERLEEEEEK